MRKTTAWGLAAIAALALTAATGAAPASAAEFTAAEYPATLYGEETAALPLTFNPPFGEVKTSCNVEFGGGKLSQKSPLFEAEPSKSFPSCSSHNLSMNGCKFTFHDGKQIVGNTFEGSIDIGPAGCGPIAYAYEPTLCTITIPSQNGLAATYENRVGPGGANVVALIPHATNLKYNLTEKACEYLDKEHKGFTNGTLGSAGTTVWNLRAKNAAGAYIGVYAGPVNSGLYLGGSPLMFESELSNAKIGGVSKSTAKFTFTGFTLSCSNTGYHGSMSGTSTTALGVEATYAECVSEGILGKLPATIVSNGCQYVYHVWNSGPPYTGSTDISCPEGHTVKVSTYANETARKNNEPLCYQEIGPQEGLGGMGYANTGSEANRSISVSAGLTGVKYTYTRKSIPCPAGAGARTDGTYSGESILFGE